MRVIVTGGAGFLGQRLARALLARETLTDGEGRRRRLAEIVLVDAVPAALEDPRAVALAGDVADAAFVAHAFEGGADSVFHMAAVVSGQAEQDFDLGWRVNVDGTRHVLEACRRLRSPPKLVFTSSVAVFGGHLPDVVADDQPLAPQSSYGAQKTIAEYMVYDFTRKGFVDGRSLRLPTVAVRPGRPNRAASSFASGMIREPLAGVEGDCPVPPGTHMWLASPRATVGNLVIGHEVPASVFGHTRSVNVPGLSVTVAEMADALRRVAGDEVAERIRWRPDPAIVRIVETWPRNFDATFGRSLGMGADDDFDAVIRQYIDENLAA